MLKLLIHSPFNYLLLSFALLFLATLYACSLLTHDLLLQDGFHHHSYTSGIWPTIRLVFFNFLGSAMLYIYFLLCSLCFDKQAYSSTQQSILEHLIYFSSFKFIVAEMVIQSSSLSPFFWFSWFSILIMTKGLIYHGHIKVLDLSTKQISYQYYHRPMAHLVICFVFIMVLGYVKTAYATRNFDTYSNISLLLCYDLVTIAVEYIQILVLYAIQYCYALGKWPDRFDIADCAVVVECAADVLLKALSVLHFSHVGYINGLNLSMVGIVVVLNINSDVAQLWKRTSELYYNLKSIFAMDTIFESVRLLDKHDNNVDKVDGDAETCPICLQEYTEYARKLPCGHLIHTSCLKQLMRKPLQHTTSHSPHVPPHLTGNRGGIVFAPSFKCPLCRQDICSTTGKFCCNPSSSHPQIDLHAQTPTAGAPENENQAGNINPLPVDNTANNQHNNWLFNFSLSSVISTFRVDLSFNLGATVNTRLAHHPNIIRPPLPMPTTANNHEEQAVLPRDPQLQDPSNEIDSLDVSNQIAVILEVFPQLSRDEIRRELMLTNNSADRAIENILSRRGGDRNQQRHISPASNSSSIFQQFLQRQNSQGTSINTSSQPTSSTLNTPNTPVMNQSLDAVLPSTAGHQRRQSSIRRLFDFKWR